MLARDHSAVRLSRDHKPNLKSEKLRIEGNGGIVAVVRGTWRVVLPQKDGLGAKICAVSRWVPACKRRLAVACEMDMPACH